MDADRGITYTTDNLLQGSTYYLQDNIYINQNYMFTSWADTKVANTTHTYKLNLIKTAKPIIMGLWECKRLPAICYLIKTFPLYSPVATFVSNMEFPLQEVVLSNNP